ncbi:hypothetical protein HA466_0135490 [Hirschfeldia incana]|nr:hypothetical protein HA466_0135490 [Hirschfeldia incana]
MNRWWWHEESVACRPEVVVWRICGSSRHGLYLVTLSSSSSESSSSAVSRLLLVYSSPVSSSAPDSSSQPISVFKLTPDLGLTL